MKQGDIIFIKNFDGSDAFNQWGNMITGWSDINLYEWTVLKNLGKTLDQLLRERMSIEENNETQ